jgi:putative FmdB family regulatory protein
MPLYVYECYDCGHQVEELRLFKDRDKPKRCTSPYCLAGGDLQRVITAHASTPSKWRV